MSLAMKGRNGFLFLDNRDEFVAINTPMNAGETIKIPRFESQLKERIERYIQNHYGIMLEQVNFDDFHYYYLIG